MVDDEKIEQLRPSTTSPSATSSFPQVGVDAVERGLELDSRKPLFETEHAAAGLLFSRFVLDEGSPQSC